MILENRSALYSVIGLKGCLGWIRDNNGMPKGKKVEENLQGKCFGRSRAWLVLVFVVFRLYVYILF